MATDDRKRVHLSLPPEAIAVLDRIGAVTGAGRATIVREWIIGALPSLTSVAAALESAQLGRLEAFEQLEQGLSQARQKADQAELDLDTGRRRMRMKGRGKVGD